jgi:hypothetical protein
MDFGSKMLISMGWTPGDPLGIRGRGIVEPVEAKFRDEKDYHGLGFEEPEVEEDQEIVEEVSVKIATAGDRYGMGISDYGKIYIPNGCLNHIAKLSGFYGGPVYVRRYLPGMYFTTSIVKGSGKHQWRASRVNILIGYMYHNALNFKWNKES